MSISVKDVFERKPGWVKREISLVEAAIMSRLIARTGATCGAEVGVASGFSSAVLFAAMKTNTDTPRLHSFDLSAECYFKRNKSTGAAFEEIHGTTDGFHLTTGVTSADIQSVEPLDFIFVDASHSTPWPAIDVLSLARFLKPGGWIALDDVDMTFVPKWQLGGKNGARDLFRAWHGKKRRYEGATSIAILAGATRRVVARSVEDSMRLDWDRPLSPEVIEKVVEIARFYGDRSAARIAKVMQSRHASHRSWKPARPHAGFLELPD